MTKYTSDYLRVSQTAFGQGALSPGGPQELSEILLGLDLTGKRVLDIGCGLGGFTCLLSKNFGAAYVEGHDVVPLLVEEAQRLVKSHGLAAEVSCKLVAADGNIAALDDSFDVVFSKDSIIHIPNKAHFYREIRRVLKAEGLFVASDWLRSDEPESEAMIKWRKGSGQPEPMVSQTEAKTFLSQAGFEQIELRDRNPWYADFIPQEIAAVKRALENEQMSSEVRELFEDRLSSTLLKLDLVKAGEHRPTHLRAFKPNT